MCEVETPTNDAGKARDRAAEKAPQKQEKKRLREEKQRRLLFPADKKGRHVMHRLNFLRVVFYPVHSIVYPFRMHGHTRVGLGPYIYVGNHFGLWDVFFPAHTTWEGIHYLAKDSVLRAPILGYWSRKLGVISAMRDGSDVRTLMEAMKVLKNGEKISMFPEGTRNKGDGEEMLPFHGGAALLAIKTKTPQTWGGADMSARALRAGGRREQARKRRGRGDEPDQRTGSEKGLPGGPGAHRRAQQHLAGD